MTGLLDLCEKYFGSRDLYEVLRIPRTANEKQVRKAYHRLSLLVHPDRVEETKKVEATEKFKVLGKVHLILSDKDKKAIYDETGTFDEEDEKVVKDWNEYWRILFKKITIEDINKYEKQYKGSEEEKLDLKRAYVDGKGDMDFILEMVPFTNTGEEPRLRSILQGMIDRGEVPEHRAFTHESPQKKERRKRKWEKEAEEAAKIDIEEHNDLVAAIQRRHCERAEEANSFFEHLAQKYGGGGNKNSYESRKKRKQPPRKKVSE